MKGRTTKVKSLTFPKGSQDLLEFIEHERAKRRLDFSTFVRELIMEAMSRSMESEGRRPEATSRGEARLTELDSGQIRQIIREELSQAKLFNSQNEGYSETDPDQTPTELDDALKGELLAMIS